MVMKRTLRNLLALAILVLPWVLWSQEQDGLGVFVRFFDKKIYYLNKTDDIKIKVDIINQTLEPIRFRVADNKLFNLDFEVKTPANVMLDHSKDFTIQRSSYQYVLFREVVLQPEEEYGFVVQLDQFIDLDRSGLFTIQGLFFPELPPTGDSQPVRSNFLALNIRPPLFVPELEALVDEDTGEVMQREEWPPDQVVEHTIRSRQRSQWEKFFLYLDIPSLIQKNPDWQVRYGRSSEEDRLELIEDYKNELKQEVVDQDILVIPSEFEILRTTYTPFEGSVIVQMKFRYRDYTEIKRYTYYLERRERFWLIADYEVTNLGTE
jgi:hypothetical protein